MVSITGDFTPVVETETVGAGDTEFLPDMIPWLDYNHTFTIEVTLGEAVVSTTRYNVGDIPPLRHHDLL